VNSAPAGLNSSTNEQLTVIAAAATFVVLKRYGPALWQRHFAAEHHPAGPGRVLATGVAVVAGAGLVTTMAVGADPLPEPPRADLVQVFDPLTGATAATFSLDNPIPRRPGRVAPMTFTSGS